MNNAYYYKNIFHGKCPYNNKACEDFECNGCKVQEEEIKFMEELDREEEKECIGLMRVVDASNYEVLYVGWNEEECQRYIDNNKLDNVWIEKVPQK